MECGRVHLAIGVSGRGCVPEQLRADTVGVGLLVSDKAF